MEGTLTQVRPIAAFEHRDDHGFTLESAGRHHLIVNLAGYRAKLACELGRRADGSTGCIVYLSNLRFWSTPEGAEIDDTDRQAIGRFLSGQLAAMWGWVDVS